MAKNREKGLLRGPMIGGRHKTVIPAAKRLLRILKQTPGVTKVTLGPIRATRKVGQVRVKRVRLQVGWRMDVRGANAIQTLYVHTDGSENMRSVDRAMKMEIS